MKNSRKACKKKSTYLVKPATFSQAEIHLSRELELAKFGIYPKAPVTKLETVIDKKASSLFRKRATRNTVKSIGITQNKRLQKAALKYLLSK